MHVLQSHQVKAMDDGSLGMAIPFIIAEELGREFI